MYTALAISHCRGRHFILETLNTAGWSGEAPLVSRCVDIDDAFVGGGPQFSAWFERRIGLTAI
jgi:hypothetical protein